MLKADIGSTEIIHRALRRGALDMYPEYVGVLLSEVAEVRSRPRGAAGSVRARQGVRAASAASRCLRRRRSRTPTRSASSRRSPSATELRTIADLKRLKGRVKVGALPEFQTRYEGLDGLREVYGLRNLRVTAVESDGRYAALDDGEVDVASVFKTEGQLAGDSTWCWRTRAACSPRVTLRRSSATRSSKPTAPACALPSMLSPGAHDTRHAQDERGGRPRQA